MKEQNLSVQDVSLSAIHEDQISTERGIRDRRLIFKLGHIVCAAFGLRFFVISKGSSVESITLFGPPDRLESGLYVLTFLMRQLQIVKKEFMNRRRTEIEERLLNQLTQNYPNQKAVQDLIRNMNL